jgi:Zn-dependent membrane protease YugP
LYAPPPTQTKRRKKYQARWASSKVKHANNKAGKQVAKQVKASEVLEEVAMVEACGSRQ